jgi:chemotaxis protein CheZ
MMGNIKTDSTLGKEIMRQAEALLSNIKDGKTDEVWHLISSLNKIREDSLFQEIGKLTRELHDALKSFQEDIDQHSDSQQFSDARERLNYVIKITEDAANRTMDGIESTIPKAQYMASEAKRLYSEWARFERREMSPQEFKELYHHMMDYLLSTQEDIDSINHNLQDVLLAQEYQDLTGQVIKRVIGLVTDVETRLVNLIQVAAEAEKYMLQSTDTHIEEKEEEYVETVAAQGPSAVACNQDEIDDILGSLGF